MSGFSTKFAECVTSGVGVIANRISNIGDYFPLENGFLIDSPDGVSIQTALIAAIEKGKVDHKTSDVFDYREYIGVFTRFIEEIVK